MSLLHYMVLVCIALAVTAAVTPLVRSMALKHHIVAMPGGRKIHKNPIPEAGGTAIIIGILAVVAVQLVGEKILGWRGFGSDITSEPLTLWGILAGTLLIYAVGLIDDRYDISPRAKLLGQIAASTVVALAGLRISFISNPFDDSIILLGILSIPVTVLYLVSFANIINLIDGLDGLAAGLSAIAATSLLVLAAGANQLAAGIIACALIGSCVGFLFFNFNPASIFMGDEGALTLGFLLGIISLMGVMKTTAAIALAVPLLIVGIPIFDTLSAIIRRVRHNRSFKEADKGHIHHRLLGRGFNQRQTVLIIYAWSAALAIGGYAIRYAPFWVRTATLIILFALTGALAYWLGLFESVKGPAPMADSQKAPLNHIQNKR